jgi:hypothetical protein
LSFSTRSSVQFISIASVPGFVAENPFSLPRMAPGHETP